MAKKTDEEVLFPSVIISEIEIKPWSFGKLFEISTLLGAVLDKAEEKGLVKEVLETGNLTYVSIVKLFTLASDEALEIIASTTGALKEEISQLSMEDGIQIAYTIFRQNRETIKNAFAPLLTKMTETTSEGEQS